MDSVTKGFPISYKIVILQVRALNNLGCLYLSQQFPQKAEQVIKDK